MHARIASLPLVVQLLVIPVTIGTVIGLLYGLRPNSNAVRPIKLHLSILIAIIGATLGLFIFANYLAAAGVSFAMVWVSRKVATTP